MLNPFLLVALKGADKAMWIMGWVSFAVLGVVLLVGLSDWILELLQGRRGDVKPGEWHLAEPDSKLRRRYFRRIKPERRAWSQGRANDPSALDADDSL